MKLITLAGAALTLVAVFLIGGLMLEGPLEVALSSATGPERVPLLLLRAWPVLAHLLLDALRG